MAFRNSSLSSGALLGDLSGCTWFIAMIPILYEDRVKLAGDWCKSSQVRKAHLSYANAMLQAYAYVLQSMLCVLIAKAAQR